MIDKLPILLCYALLGLMLALWPTVSLYLQGMRANTGVALPISWSLLAVIFGLAGLAVVGTPLLIFSLISIAVVVAFDSKKHFDPVYALAILLGLLVAATLPWWRIVAWQGVNISNPELVFFTLISILLLWLFSKSHDASWQSTAWRFVTWSQFAGFVLIGVVLSFNTGIFNDQQIAFLAWHHWGAYIGPSELLLRGARLFHDFPAQYGFGPTLLIAAACGSNCWDGMYYVVALSSLCFYLLIVMIALGSTGQNPIARLLTLLLCLVTCFFWSGYPPGVGLSTVTPSVGALRFLPALALAASLILTDRKNLDENYQVIIGHGIWSIALLWSPESAFIATFIWAPYYLLRRVATAKGGERQILAATGTLGILLMVFAAVVAGFLTIYWLVYRTLPSIVGYLTYQLNPPGEMAANLKGSIWFFIAVMGLGIHTNWRTFQTTGNNQIFRRGFLLSLLAYGTFVYYLGRSHDNNILNLLPFSLLILLNTHASPVVGIPQGISRAMLSCLLAWLGLFGWEAWNRGIQSGTIYQFDPVRLRNSFSYQNPLMASWLLQHSISNNPKDVVSALANIQKNYDEPITMLDRTFNLVSTGTNMAWSAIHPPANYAFVPSAQRREFLRNTAITLRQPGWLLINKNFAAAKWLSDFQSVYTETSVIDFNSYYAIRYVLNIPRPPPPTNLDLFNQALSLQLKGEKERSIPLYRQYLIQEPDYYQAHFNLACALMDTGQCPAAIAEFERTLELWPGYKEAHLHLARCYQETGHQDEMQQHTHEYHKK